MSLNQLIAHFKENLRRNRRKDSLRKVASLISTYRDPGILNSLIDYVKYKPQGKLSTAKWKKVLKKDTSQACHNTPKMHMNTSYLEVLLGN
jgi:hypothetical protein